MMVDYQSYALQIRRETIDAEQAAQTAWNEVDSISFLPSEVFLKCYQELADIGVLKPVGLNELPQTQVMADHVKFSVLRNMTDRKDQETIHQILFDGLVAYLIDLAKRVE